VLIRDDDTAARDIAPASRTSECGSRSTTSAPATRLCRICSAFPSDKIKIDRCFVPDNRGDRRLVIDRGGGQEHCHARHMTTTAEGVETEQPKGVDARLGLHPNAGYLVQRGAANGRRNPTTPEA